MNMIQKIVLSITRRKKKSLILFALILLINTIVATIFVVQSEVESINNNMRLAYGGTVEIVLDFKKLQKDNVDEEQFYKIKDRIAKEFLTKDKIVEFGNQENVKEYDYYYQYTLFSSTLQKYSVNELENENSVVENWQSFKIEGTNKEQTQGGEKLVAGQGFSLTDINTGANKAIISQKLASKNEIELGDTIVFEEVVSTPETIGVIEGEILFDKGDKNNALITKQISLEVIGLIEENDTTFESEFENEKWTNKIFVPNKIIEDEFDFVQKFLNQDSSEQSYKLVSLYNVEFVLKDPNDVEEFRTDVNERLDNYLTTEVSQNGYEDIKASLSSMNELINYSLVLTVIIGGLLIGVLFLMQLRERKRELGIYVALGEPKYKIILTLLGELLVISFIACTMSLISGNVIADIVSKNVITVPKLQNIQEQQPEESNDSIQKEASYGSWIYIINLYGAVFFICIISVSVSGAYVLWLNPRKILL